MSVDPVHARIEVSLEHIGHENGLCVGRVRDELLPVEAVWLWRLLIDLQGPDRLTRVQVVEVLGHFLLLAHLATDVTEVVVIPRS